MLYFQTDNNFLKRKKTLNCNGKILDLSKPAIMGILNTTPDSFYDGGAYPKISDSLNKVEQMLNEGASIIDVGGMSSRPGAAEVSANEESARIRPVLKAITQQFPDAIVSVDTYRAQVAQMAVEEFGAGVINDISAGSMDAAMFDTIARLQVPYVMMHMQGNPQNMQENPSYDDLIKTIFDYFADKLRVLKELGVNDIIIDLGFGFGKTLEHNYELLKSLDKFKILELPLLVGVSRKSMVYKLLKTEPEQALNGTTVLHTIALLNGADILRVHDVKEAAEAIKITRKLMKAEINTLMDG